MFQGADRGVPPPRDYESVRGKLGKDLARDFLVRLGGDSTKFTFQTFGDGENKTRGLAHIIHSDFESACDRLLMLNEKGAGIFVCVNETDLKGRSTENVI